MSSQMIVTQGSTSLVKVCAVFTKKTISNTNIYLSKHRIKLNNYTLTTIALHMYISIIHCNLHYVPQYYYGHKPIHFKLVTFKHLIPSILHD